MNPNVQQKIHEFFSQYPLRSYPKGQILVFADENPEHIFYIAKGRVRKYDVSYRGDEIILNIFKSPSFFPMSWAINRTPNHYFYKTEISTEVHIVPVEDADNFIKTNPDVMYDLLDRVYRGMNGLFGRIVHLMSGTAKSRVIYELIIETRRFGQQQKDGSYLLNLNESDLAARAGMSRETISRELSKLKRIHLVTVSSKGITVLKLPELEQMIGVEI